MDDSRPDDAFDRELRRALAAGGGAASSSHVDAEVAAAWMDRRLDADASRAIEVHLAECADCQTAMATLAQLTPDEPDVAASVSWWRRIRAGWLVPAAVAAAAGLVIWVAVPQQRTGVPLELEPPVAAPVPAAPAVEAAPSATLDSAARAERNARTPQFAPERDRVGELEQTVKAAPPANEPSAPAAPPAAARANAALADAAPPADAKENAGAVSQSALESRRADKATVTGDTPATAPERKEATTALRHQGAPAAPSPAPPPQASVAQERSLVGATAAGRLANALTIVAPDGAARWRRTGTAIEFAPRASAAFAAAALPVAADAVASGASPGGTICWLVGRGGLVLITTDGVRFAQAAVPAPLDLRDITPTDARTAVVTAVNGRRFRTADQGATWTPVP